MAQTSNKGWWPTNDELQMLVDHVECLPPITRHVMDMRYGIFGARTLTHAEISKEMKGHFTPDRVRTIEMSGWNRVRAAQKKELERCRKDASGEHASRTLRVITPTEE